MSKFSHATVLSRLLLQLPHLPSQSGPPPPLPTLPPYDLTRTHTSTSVQPQRLVPAGPEQASEHESLPNNSVSAVALPKTLRKRFLRTLRQPEWEDYEIYQDI